MFYYCKIFEDLYEVKSFEKSKIKSTRVLYFESYIKLAAVILLVVHMHLLGISLLKQSFWEL